MIRGLHVAIPTVTQWRAVPPAERALRFTAFAALILLGICLLGVLFDPRVITGAPVWAKPAKFSLSVTLYAFSLAWMIGLVRRGRRLVNSLALLISVVLWLELAIIVTQVLRGTSSHFNLSTTLDAYLFAAMGLAISLLWIGHLLLTVVVFLERLRDPLLALGLRLALVVTLLGLAQGGLMLLPTAGQRTGLAAGHFAGFIGAHSVGVPDGGPSLPLVGWSATGGDLRVGHFLGLHALQVIPLLGYALRRRRDRFTDAATQRLRLLTIGGLAYLGLIVLTTWQALRGEAPLEPSAATVLGYAVWAVIALTMTGLALRSRRRA